MFANSSNTTSSLPAQAPPIGIYQCFLFRFSFSIFLSFSVSNLLALTPCCLSVWLLGLQRCRRREPASHSDVFTYHLVAMEMVSVSACAVYLRGFWEGAIHSMFVAMHVHSLASYGQVYFHILTCLDRYVAVVHPIAYLRLKERGGIKVRNALIVCAWLLFFLKVAVNLDYDGTVTCVYLSLSIAAVLFCNFAVLHALMRPPPGERVHVSRSKRRAFNTIVVILSVLLFRIIMHLSVVGVYESGLLDHRHRCAALVSGVFASLPNSLVLPLLFLCRAKELSCRKNADG